MKNNIENSFTILVIAYIVFFTGCVEEKTTFSTETPTTTASITSEPEQTNISNTYPVYYRIQQEARTSASIDILSGTEEITIYVPVLLDENKNVMKMYETPTIVGNVTTAIIDTKYGKALKINGSGLGDYLFSWNDVPGNDTDRFVNWLKDNLPLSKEGKPDITKTDGGEAIIVSGKYEPMPSLKAIYTFRLNKEKNRILYDYSGSDCEMAQCGSLFVKEKSDKLNTYNGIIHIEMNEKHGLLKEDKQTTYDFFKRFTISMSNYTSPEPFINMTNSEYPPVTDAWIYSDSELEKLSLNFYIDPSNRIDRIALFMNSQEGTGSFMSPIVHPKEGWQVMNLSGGLALWD